jgi:uncharacterized protein YegL
MKKNKVCFILDASGSMSHLTNNVIKMVNENIDEFRKESVRLKQKTEISVIAFDYPNNIQYIYKDIDVKKAEKITHRDYSPNGSTALFDAVATGIKGYPKIKKSLATSKEDDTSYVIIAITDGEENSSEVYDSRRGGGAKLAELFNEVQKTLRWTITFQVPHGGKSSLVRMGISSDNIREWEQTSEGVHEAMQYTSAGIRSYMKSRSLGATSVENFYVQTDLSDLSTKQLKKELDDISDDYGIFTVSNDTQVKDFVENKTKRPYVKGRAYYQLVKTEQVQSSKDILIFDKGKTALYGGDDARELIGLPVGGNAKVVPGNHANYEIFVQSTSVNRKLPAGTKVAIKVT